MSYIIHAPRHDCNLLLPETSAPTRSLYYTIGIKLTPKCHGAMDGCLGGYERWKVLPLAKRGRRSQRGRLILVRNSSQFLFLVLLRQNWLLMAAVAQPALSFHFCPKAKVLSLPCKINGRCKYVKIKKNNTSLVRRLQYYKSISG